MDLRIERQEVRLHFWRRIVDLAEQVGPVQTVVGVVVIENADADDARREVELRLTPYQSLLCQFSCRRVEAHAHEAARSTGRVVQEPAARLEPHGAGGVRADDSILGSIRLALT